MIDRLLLIGCGKMGGALLDGWLAGHAASTFDVVEPGPAPVPQDARVRRYRTVDAVPAAPDVVVLAVKPQSMDQVLPEVARLAGPRPLVLSIAAGTPLARFAAAFGADTPVVRAMPNTPAAIGRGASVLVANAHADAAARDRATGLMAVAGTVDWVEDEGLIDAVTAVSGGGPAYVFLLIEVLAEAGAAAGLPADLAGRIARQTVIGAGALAAASEEGAARLRRNVTSPNGTTERALAVLMAKDGLQPLFDRAIAAAAARSRELAG